MRHYLVVRETNGTLVLDFADEEAEARNELGRLAMQGRECALFQAGSITELRRERDEWLGGEIRIERGRLLSSGLA